MHKIELLQSYEAINLAHVPWFHLKNVRIKSICLKNTNDTTKINRALQYEMHFKSSKNITTKICLLKGLSMVNLGG